MEPEKTPQNSLMTSSRSRESLMKWLGVMMAQAQARFPSYELPEVTKKLYLVDWIEMVREFGERRFQVGLERTLRKARFFPLPGEIRELIPEAEPKSTYQPPTEADKQAQAFWKTEEGQKTWAEFKQQRDRIFGKKSMPAKEEPAYIPTTVELAEELGKNPYLNQEKLSKV